MHPHSSERDNAPAALRGVTFETHPAEKLGVVGRTGAGKSSLLQAILRLATPSRGRVLVDGVDVATVHLHALRLVVFMEKQKMNHSSPPRRFV